MVKVTFSLDAGTVGRLRRVSARLGRPQSRIVGEAIEDYVGRIGKLSERERSRMLSLIDAALEAPATRKPAEVDAEIKGVRASRRLAARRRGSRSPA